MSRRLLFIGSFAALIAVASWYGISSIDVPELTFKEAAMVNDAKKKVIVSGHVASGNIVSDDGALTFFMRDESGDTSRVQYEGQDPFTPEELQEVFRRGAELSVSGHSHGEYFHSTGMTLH